jgi:hypothetical protein
VSKGSLLAAFLFVATIGLVVVGTLWPVPSAAAFAGGETAVGAPTTPESAANNLGSEIKSQDWQKAYASLANKAQFSQQDFVNDLTGSNQSLQSNATLNNFEVFPLHSDNSEAQVRMKFYWSTVVGTSVSARDVHLVRNGDRWQAEWPLAKEPVVPPQVIPVNYLRWDVVYRGAGDDWGAQDVEAPHVRIIDMHPVERADGVVILGELLNEDVVPAYVSVNATLLSKSQTPIATEGSFDKISHLLLPKQVTPFFIQFPDTALADVGSVRMTPFSTLVPASADPVIAVDDEKLNPAPDASLTGQLINQSGRPVSVAHVLGTFYNKSGQVVWVGDQYVPHALLPDAPIAFNIHIPEDLAKNVSSQRTVVASYSSTAGGAM